MTFAHGTEARYIFLLMFLSLFLSVCLSSFHCIVNCWPSDNGEGGCDVNIEYELEAQHLELQDVAIVIPLP